MYLISLDMPYYMKLKKKEENLPLFKSTGVKIKKRTNLIAKLDRIFSIYIRLRDAMPNGYFKCISCGQFKKFEQADCGHLFSRTHMSTRFDEENCNAECARCNRFCSEHLIGYRKNLIAKIGEHRFDVLEWRAHQTKKWSDFELEAMINHYKKEAKKLSVEKGLKVNI